MNKLQLLITDIDGTLLNTQKNISKQTLDYLIHLQQKGVVIALCSGRIPAELQSFIEQLQLDKYGGYIIHTNGAGIINCKTSESISFSPIYVNEMQELIGIAKKNNLYTIVEYNDSYIVDCNLFVQFKRILTKLFWPEWLRFKNPVLTQFRYMSNHSTRVSNIITTINAPVNKLCFRGASRNVNKFEEYILTHNDTYNGFRLTKGCIEVNHASVSKGVAAKYLANMLNISLENTVAFGDSANDHALLTAIPNSVAMQNADSTTKSLAKYTTKSNDEDGIVHFLTKSNF